MLVFPFGTDYPVRFPKVNVCAIFKGLPDLFRWILAASRVKLTYMKVFAKPKSVTKARAGDVLEIDGKYYVVEEAKMAGGGTGHGPHDVYPDGWQVTASKLAWACDPSIAEHFEEAFNKLKATEKGRPNLDELLRYDPKARTIQFYQSGCFSGKREMPYGDRSGSHKAENLDQEVEMHERQLEIAMMNMSIAEDKATRSFRCLQDTKRYAAKVKRAHELCPECKKGRQPFPSRNTCEKNKPLVHPSSNGVVPCKVSEVWGNG
jgi:hypothetical protein